jgi:hypothetical protein
LVLHGGLAPSARQAARFCLAVLRAVRGAARCEAAELLAAENQSLQARCRWLGTLLIG